MTTLSPDHAEAEAIIEVVLCAAEGVGLSDVLSNNRWWATMEGRYAGKAVTEGARTLIAMHATRVRAGRSLLEAASSVADVAGLRVGRCVIERIRGAGATSVVFDAVVDHAGAQHAAVLKVYKHLTEHSNPERKSAAERYFNNELSALKALAGCPAVAGMCEDVQKVANRSAVVLERGQSTLDELLVAGGIDA
ncbi:MAG: hypothetical protein ACT4PL_02590, partial [Phycisphaerales bacterium]